MSSPDIRWLQRWRSSGIYRIWSGRGSGADLNTLDQRRCGSRHHPGGNSPCIANCAAFRIAVVD